MKTKFYILLLIGCAGLPVPLIAQCFITTLMVNDAPCAIGTFGNVELAFSGASFPLSYDVSGDTSINGNTSSSPIIIDGLPPGSYSIKLTDAQSCMDSTPFTIGAPPELTVIVSSITDVLCNGDENGSATLQTSGGTPPYFYAWPGNNDPTSNTATNLASGNYLVTINDNNGCFALMDFLIGEPQGLLIDGFVTNVDCFRFNAGAIDLTVTGGTGIYQFNWSNGATTPSLTDLEVGNYTVTVTDGNDCTGEATFGVDSSRMTVSIIELSPACGGCSGSVEVRGIGGDPPYFYDWADSNSGAVIFDQCPSTNIVTVTDAQGCTATTSVLFEDIPADTIVLEIETEDISCGSLCNGTVQINVHCGQGPFIFDWSVDQYDGVSSTGEEYIGTLCEGIYNLRVTDANGLWTITQIDIGGTPDTLPIALTSVTVIESCETNCSGGIDIELTGGIPPYTYIWNTGETDQNLSAVYCSGDYQVTIVDSRGCTFISNIYTIEEALQVGEIIEPASCNMDGSIELIVSGGVPPYIFTWAHDPSLTDGQATNLAGGEYSVTISDQVGCITIRTITISEALGFEVDITPANCDSTGGIATVVLQTTITNVAYAWSNGASTASQSNLTPGDYSVTVTDLDNACSEHKNLEVPLHPSCFVRIKGNVFGDGVVADCVADPSTIDLSNILVTLDNGMQQFTDWAGRYSFLVVPANYEISIDWDSTIFTNLCANPISLTATTPGTTYADNDFYLDFDEYNDLAIKVSKLNPRPGFTRSVRICVMNYGAEPMDGTLTFVHDPLQIYSAASTMPDNYDANSQTLTWNFTDHPPGFINVITVQLTTPANVPPGTLLDYHFVVDPIAGDINPLDNEITRQCVVTNSYDPNDKQVLPLGEGVLGGIRPDLGDSLLSYHIRFQNTGTDTAFTVIVRDTLDSDLEVRNVQPGPSSHPYELVVVDGNVLEFRFENIYLPDSNVNEPLSHGFVFFDVQLDRDLPVAAEIHNTAAIYFDFNAPVITNTVQNTIFGPAVHTSLELEGCGQLNYNGTTYTMSAEVVDTIDLIYYDSIVTANLVVYPAYDDRVEITLEQGEVYQGMAYFSDTTFTQFLTTIDGCDSIIIVVIDVLITSITSVDESLIELVIYPNPSLDLFHIDINAIEPTLIQWKLINVLGELVDRGHWQIGRVSKQKLNLHARSSGVYWLLLESEGMHYIEKLIKY